VSRALRYVRSSRGDTFEHRTRELVTVAGIVGVQASEKVLVESPLLEKTDLPVNYPTSPLTGYHSTLSTQMSLLRFQVTLPNGRPP
jgi:hypothetical protein